jgi:hypothetical protein
LSVPERKSLDEIDETIRLSHAIKVHPTDPAHEPPMKLNSKIGKLGL